MPVEAAIPPRTIDFSRPFFPPRLTALAHVPSWSRLDEAQRRRYTQLYALYLNEQTVFFEELLAGAVLPALYRRLDRLGADLAAGLRRFEAEEKRHSRWFRELNHRVDPTRFSLAEGSYHFIPAGPGLRRLATFLIRRPFALPCWIWLMLLQEERSIAVSRECLRPELELEPTFRQLHRRHMADEIDHVRWDLQLIDRVWRPLPLWRRRLHARLFGALMREFFTRPKRAARAVLQSLLAEFAELRPLGPQLHRELAALAASPDYHASLYSRTMTPRCFALFDELPEFHDIGRSLPAYRRPA